MQHPLIVKYEAEDIDAQVDKILRGLGNPEPPLKLDDVRQLLRLDKQYYSSSDHSAIRDIVSRVRIAGKQILERPTLLIDAIRKADIRALYIPDQKRILIDQDAPILKHRWNEGHEIGHSIIPWHSEFLFGDTEYSLKPVCHEKLEVEANYACGQLIFLHRRFATEASDHVPNIKSIKALQKIYGNTLTSTLWRFVEEAHSPLPMVGVMSGHPRHPNETFDAENPCKHIVPSPSFRQKFSKVDAKTIFAGIKEYCTYSKGGPLGEGDVKLKDDNGEQHHFRFESFSNTHEVLTIASYTKPSLIVC